MPNGLSCTYSYATWRLLVFRQLFDISSAPSTASSLRPQISVLQNRSQLGRTHFCSTSRRVEQRTSSSDQYAVKSDKSKVPRSHEQKRESKPRSQLTRGDAERPIGIEGSPSAEPIGRDAPRQAHDDSKSAYWEPPEALDKHNIKGLLTSLKSITEDLKRQERTAEEHLPEYASKSLVDDLPTSPLEKAFQKTKRKSRPKRQPTQEEKERLANNPWAAMLAAPLRVDAASKTRFPNALLMEMGQVVNPDDKQIYMMPDNLADLKAFKAKMDSGSRKNATKGSLRKDGEDMSRILPYKLLVEDLTDYCMAWDTSTSTSRTKRGTVAKRMVPSKTLEKAQKLVAFQNASKEYWDVREKQGELDDGLFKRPEKGFDYNKLQWQPSISERIPDIMRQRVLLALNYVLQKQHQLENNARIYTYCLRWPNDHVINLNSLPTPTTSAPGKEDFWNDMGDIESVDAISGGSSHQGNRSDPRPPIAIQASEIRQEVKTTPNVFDKDDPRVWVPGSFVLHLGPPDSTLEAIPNLDHSSTSPMSSNPSKPATKPSKYIPSMLSINLQTHDAEPDTYRLPTFNLPALLGPKLSTILPKLLQRYQHLQPSHEASFQLPLADQNFIILVKSVSPGSHFLAQELWQLWRYLGGQDCLLHPQPESTQNADGKASARPARAQRGRSDYEGLSDRAWAYLHELLELEMGPQSEGKTDG